MAKYFGCESREDFIHDIDAGEIWIEYKDSSYIFTYDGRGWNCMLEWIIGRELTDDEMRKMSASADTIEELINKVVLYDGTTLNEALEMDL